LKIIIVLKNSELKSCFGNIKPEADCNEAGRGCFAVPVFAAVVILSDNFEHHLNNSIRFVTFMPCVRLIQKCYCEKS
jgi:ribonuclease HII